MILIVRFLCGATLSVRLLGLGEATFFRRRDVVVTLLGGPLTRRGTRRVVDR